VTICAGDRFFKRIRDFYAHALRHVVDNQSFGRVLAWIDEENMKAV